MADEALRRDRSPIFFADRIRAPLLPPAEADDIRCPAKETQQVVDAVRRVGWVAEAKIYEREGRGARACAGRRQCLRSGAGSPRRLWARCAGAGRPP